MIAAEIENIRFDDISPQPIQYKKLKPEHFKWANGETKYELIEPDDKGYVTDKLYEKLIKDSGNRNTCIVNIGVGRGKTTAACKIIHHYASQQEYVVILASPFKKLVQRDHKHLLEKNDVYQVVNYEILENKEVPIEELSSAQVHIITLNSLMFNPGEENVEITLRKRLYCRSIQDYCRKNGKKVVFVFDEIHAGIHCFQEEFIFNLRAWKDITHKCFILSATFTEPARVAIEYIAYLTDYKIYIVETERKKFPLQSNLQLYVTDGKYSARDLSLLAPLKDIVDKAVAGKKRVHIVTAFKDMADKLAEPDESNHPLLRTIKELNPNLVTGESKIDFDQTTSNIGTTFYTGIDLKDKDDILVLIMPSAESQFADKIGGIFSSGKIAISQAIARLRTDGDIHVFMPKSDLFIEGDYLQKVSPKVMGQIEKHKALDDEELLKELIRFYNAQKNLIDKEITKAEGEIKGEVWNDRAPLNYPSLASFILNKGMSYLIQRYASFGKGFTPYVLWAALNDQFENTTLKTINFVRHATEKLELQKQNIEELLLNYYGGIENVKELIKGKNLRQAFGALFSLLYYKKNPDSAYGKRVELYWEGTQISLRYAPPIIKQTIVNIIYWSVQGEKVNVESDLWIKNQIAKYQDKNNWNLNLHTERKWYFKMEETRTEFCARVIKNNMIASLDLFDDDFLFTCFEVVRGVNNEDFFLKNRTFNFCRTVGVEKAEEKNIKLTHKHFKQGGVIIERLRKKIFNGYKTTFTKSKFEKKGSAQVESFYAIPEKHFYSSKIVDIAKKKRKQEKKETRSPSLIKRIKMEREYMNNNQKFLDKFLNNVEVQHFDLKKLAKRQRKLQELLGWEDASNFFYDAELKAMTKEELEAEYKDNYQRLIDILKGTAINEEDFERLAKRQRAVMDRLGME